MAFFKKVQKAINKKWYPQSILVGSPVTTDQIAKRVAQESTVAPADVRAVLTALSGVMGDYMSLGRSVKLDGIGSYYFQAKAKGNGVETKNKCSAKQINGVKIIFIPETTYGRGVGGRKAIRALADVDIEWIDVETLNPKSSAINDGDEDHTGGEPSGGDLDD